jgi:hypothetical protein
MPCRYTTSGGVVQRARQEHNDAYAHSVASAVAAAAGQGSAQQQSEAVGTSSCLQLPCRFTPLPSQVVFIANIIQACIYRGRLSNCTSPQLAHASIAAALSSPGDTAASAAQPDGQMRFAALASDIEKQSTEWNQLLLKLQQKNAGDVKDALSDSGLAVQLLQSRLTKLIGTAAADCASVQVAVATACSRMAKVMLLSDSSSLNACESPAISPLNRLQGVQVITCTPFITAA